MGSYLREIFSVFFRWWWAVATGLATLLGWVSVPSDHGLTLSKFWASLLILVGLTLLFLVFSALTQSYAWFCAATCSLSVRQIVKTKEHEAGWTFIISTPERPLKTGFLIAIYREVAGEEVCIGILKPLSTRHDGQAVHCTPLWMSPGHQQELSAGKLRASDLIVRLEISESAAKQYAKEETK